MQLSRHQAHLDTPASLCFRPPAAGYRPATFNVRQASSPAASCYPPAALGSKWELTSSGKWLWLAAQRVPWSPASHASFPPAFREAARALLLAAHRSASGAAPQPPGSAASLGTLPQPLLLGILGQAAYPLSAWCPSMDTGSILDELKRRAVEARAEAKAEYEELYQGALLEAYL